MSTFSYNGTELELDLLDAVWMEKYEKANDALVSRAEEAAGKEDLKAYESMRTQCSIINDFFDNLFGRGTAEKLFGNNENVKIRFDAYDLINQMVTDATKELNEIARRYKKPAPKNREQRRAEAKKR